MKKIILAIICYLFLITPAFANHVSSTDACKTNADCTNLREYCEDNNTYQCTGGYCDPSHGNHDEFGCVRSCNVVATGCDSVSKVFGRIETPENIKRIGFGATGINNLLIFAVRFIYSLAGLILLFMIIWGGWEWMTSGGDKEKVSAARKRIMNAIIGITIMALAFFIAGVLGKIINFDFNDIGVRVLRP